MGSRCYECGEKFGRCYEHGGACECDIHTCPTTNRPPETDEENADG